MFAYIVEYESVQDVLDEQPDMNLLKALGKRTAITTAGWMLLSLKSRSTI